MCSNPCESELTCFRPESNRAPYGLLNFWSAAFSTTEILCVVQKEILLFIGKPKGRSIMISNVIHMCDMTHPCAQLDSFLWQYAEQNTAVSAVYTKFLHGYLAALAPKDARPLGDIAQVERIKSRDLIKWWECGKPLQYQRGRGQLGRGRTNIISQNSTTTNM